MTPRIARHCPSSKKAARSDAGFSGDCAWFEPIALELRDIFTRNTAKETAFRAGCDISTAERWLSGKTAPQGEALARLLCSDIGDRLHAALIENVQTPWAEARRAELMRTKLLREREEIERRLAALEGNKK